MPWNFKRWGTAQDPIHKSDLNSITGDFGCLRAFRYTKDRRADGGARENTNTVGGKMAAGTAAHETIARALNNAEVQAKLLAGTWQVSTEQIRSVFLEELERAREGRELVWYGKDDADDVITDRVAMVTGLLNDLHTHVHSVELIEAGFIVKLGDYWLSGHVDLVYRPKSEPWKLALCDWKTGATKPHPIELDHGWESGIYSLALHDGLWVRREDVEVDPNAPSRYQAERDAVESKLISFAEAIDNTHALTGARWFGEFPTDIRYVHLQDYVPYQKAGKKKAQRSEELAFYGLTEPGEVKYTAHERRGPAWYQVRRTEQDIPRLEHLLRNVVGTVRMGRFFESVGEKCDRCSFKSDCLTTGYQVRGNEQKQLESALRTLPTTFSDGLDDVA